MASLTCTVAVTMLIAIFAFFMPLRWGWKAFPLAAAGSIIAVAVAILGSSSFLYRDGGGFVVHFGLVHMAVAGAFGAMAFRTVQKYRLS